MDFLPGLYEGISESDYHADSFGDSPTLSSSIAKLLVSRTPAHAFIRHPRLGGTVAEAGDEDGEDKDAERRRQLKERGSIVHGLLLGGGAPVELIDASDWRKPGNRELREEARGLGKLPCLAPVYEDLAVAAAEAEKNLVADYGIYLADLPREVVALWEESGVRCRARIDALDLPEATKYDLKVWRDGTPASFGRSMIPLGLDIQEAAYTSALATLYPDLAGRLKMKFLRLELTPPYAPSVHEGDGSMQSHGGSRWRRALPLWKRCLESGHWPRFGGEVFSHGAPPWALEEEMLAAGNPEPDWMAGA